MKVNNGEGREGGEEVGFGDGGREVVTPPLPLSLPKLATSLGFGFAPPSSRPGSDSFVSVIFCLSFVFFWGFEFGEEGGERVTRPPPQTQTHRRHPPIPCGKGWSSRSGINFLGPCFGALKFVAWWIGPDFGFVSDFSSLGVFLGFFWDSDSSEVAKFKKSPPSQAR